MPIVEGQFANRLSTIGGYRCDASNLLCVASSCWTLTVAIGDPRSAIGASRYLCGSYQHGATFAAFISRAVADRFLEPIRISGCPRRMNPVSSHTMNTSLALMEFRLEVRRRRASTDGSCSTA